MTDDRPLTLFLALFLVLMLAVASEAFEVKRAGFVGMRGKKEDSNLEDLIMDLYSQDPELFEETKRSGFVGMRGKKDEIYDKRAGFVGMRGKKSSQLPRRYEYSWPSFWSYNLPRESRGSSSGFYGMRG